MKKKPEIIPVFFVYKIELQQKIVYQKSTKKKHLQIEL